VRTGVLGNDRFVVTEPFADRYELEQLVGTGGMSSVYKAHDTQLDRYVALKLLHSQYGDDDEYVERFRREARAVAQLSHPNIVRVIDRGEADGRQYIVFEYVDGENLKELLERSGPLSVRRALELGLQIAHALSFAHEHGLVHRDVKPQNVLLNGDDEAKVTDFGIARSLDVERGMTQTGTVLGTSNYIAPEQASGKRVDAHTDVYSLGVVLYELLTGELPFPGDNFVAVAMKHVNEPPPSLVEKRPDVPIRVALAIERALEKSPDNRFPTMAAFAAELDTCLQELDHPDTEDPTLLVPRRMVEQRKPAPARKRRGRWGFALAVLVLAAIAAVVGGVLALRGSDGTGSQSSPPPATAGVQLQGVGIYDPSGAHADTHGSSAPQATDGNPGTYWYTQRYASQDFGGLKDGLGLVLSTGKSVALKRLTVTTDTPGFEAKILVGDAPTGNFSDNSETQLVGASTTFTLAGRSGSYYVVWLTSLPPGGVAHVNEVHAS
jgi:serine/threonine-protein kinase